MKTAKQVLTSYSDGDYTQFEGYKNILMAMKEYAKQKCERQREISLKALYYVHLTKRETNALKRNRPKFD